MRLDFDTLELEGYSSFIERQTWHLGRRGFHFLRGVNKAEPRLEANDAGKSTLINALSWVLFGRTINELRNPDITPWTVKMTTSVVLRLLIDGKEHYLHRTANPNALQLDGEDIAQETLETKLRFGFKTFSHTIIFGQGRDLFFDLTAGKKMEVLAEALDLERWNDRSERASKAATALQKEIAEVDGEMLGYTNTLTELKALFKRAETQAQEWEDERKQLVETAKDQLAQLEKRAAVLQKDHDAADLKYDGYMTELRAVEKQAKGLRDLVLTTKQAFNRAELQIQALKEKHDRLVEEAKAIGDKCPTCGQSLKGNKLTEHRDRLKAEIATLTTGIKAGVPKKVSDALATAEAQVAQAIAEGDRLMRLATAAKDTLDSTTPELSQLKARIELLSRSQHDRAGEVNPHREQLALLRKKQSKLESNLDDAREDKELLTKNHERVKFWVKGFKDIRLFIIDEVVSELELAINSELAEVGLEGWRVVLDVERETKSGTVTRGLNVDIISPRNDKPVKWESWGGGVSQRLRLISALALSEVLLAHAGVDCSLEILDEPTRHLSTGGMYDLAELLADRAERTGKACWYVDHRTVHASYFTSELTVVKTAKHGSVLED